MTSSSATRKRTARSIAALLGLVGTLACGSPESRETSAEAVGAVSASPATSATTAVTSDAGATGASGTTGTSGNAPSAVDPASPFERLRGRWLRPDGGYLLEVVSITPDGKVEATYRNPRPINVSRAQASLEGGNPGLYVELKDVNYPGSTYRLLYVPGRDVLEGTYFQALQQQTFDVAFVRQ